MGALRAHLHKLEMDAFATKHAPGAQVAINDGATYPDAGRKLQRGQSELEGYGSNTVGAQIP